MPLSERLRINSGRSFTQSLFARAIVAIVLLFMLVFANALKKRDKHPEIYNQIDAAKVQTINLPKTTSIVAESGYGR